MRTAAVVYVNGKRVEVGGARAGWMLADFLRLELGLTGTKIVCGEGDCGACTVLRRFAGAGRGAAGATGSFVAINACIATVAQMDGSSLVTIEALGSPDALSPVQEALHRHHGSQCGFCTPGFVMSLTALVEETIAKSGGRSAVPLTVQAAKNALTGNLCRCTGYQQILDAATAVDLAAHRSLSERFYTRAIERDLREATARPIQIDDDGFSFEAPTSLAAAVRVLRRRRSGLRVLGAATDLGVAHNKHVARLRHTLSLHLVPDLYRLRVSRAGDVEVGARVTLAELRLALRARAPEIARFLDLFASPQIKNVATLVGNVANASPIADTPPFLLVCDAVVEAAGPRGARSIPLDRFYLGYRRTALRQDEIVTAIRFRLPSTADSFALFKASERKDLDISAVNAGFRLRFAGGARRRIVSARLALGGVAPTPIRLARTEAALTNAAVSPDRLAGALSALHQDIAPIGDVRGSAAYRRVVAENLLRRFLRDQTGVAL